MTTSRVSSVATHTTSPTALRTSSALLRCAAFTFSGAYMPLMPAPSSAGRLGIARTTGTSLPHQASRSMTRVPASTEMMSGRRRGEGGGEGLEHRLRLLRLHRQHHDLGAGDRRLVVGARRDAELARERSRAARDTLAHAQLLGAGARAHQAREQGAAHVAGAEDA